MPHLVLVFEFYVPCDPAKMFPHYSMAAWVIGVWHALPYSLQVPIAITIFTYPFMGFQSLDSWVKSLRKDPIHHLCWAVLVMGVGAVAVQLLYRTFTWAAVPVQEIWDTYNNVALIPLAASNPTIPSLLLAIIVLLPCIIPVTWWLAKLVGSY